MAERSGKVEVLPLHVVTDISESRDEGLYHVEANEIDVDGNVLRRKTFTCRYLFMAAGSVGTSALLTKAKAKKTLRRLNDFVGTNWGGNGDFIAARSGVGNFLPSQGGPCGHYLAQDDANPYSPTAMVELVIPSNAPFSFPSASLYVGLGIAPPLGTFSYDGASNTTTLIWPNTHPALDNFSAGVNSMLERLDLANGTIPPARAHSSTAKVPAGRETGCPLSPRTRSAAR